MGKTTGIRTRAWLLMFVVVTLVAAACGSDSADTPTTTAAAAATPTTAAAAATTTTAAESMALAKVAVLVPEEPVDFGWNQQGVEGAVAAANAAGIGSGGGWVGLRRSDRNAPATR